jgi:uncharacterized protein (TIGR02757 family)
LNPDRIKDFLELKVKQYNRKAFIENDPVCIPHLFSRKQDIEIMGFFAATLAWGQRKTIISNCKKLAEAMDMAPHDFVLHHSEKDLEAMAGFVHRTFNDTDLLYFLSFLQQHYRKEDSLETLFSAPLNAESEHVGPGLKHFHRAFFSLEYAPERTRKHVATPERKSACKRLNMFLRWMVRKDRAGVDFGIWKSISPSQLICPLDTHVHRVASGLGLLDRKQADWEAALRLTSLLKQLDPDDPVKFDYALFGLGIEERF